MNQMLRKPAGAEPLYQSVKRFIVDRIRSGDWPVDHRVPSETELTRDFGVSRMTVHRALRELSGEGLLTRVQGVGTFVAAGKAQSSPLEIRNIAEEIRGRGHTHTSDVRLLREEPAKGRAARHLGLPDGAPVFHSLVLHRENGIPVQLEERYVNPAVAPDYLDQDFSRVTPNEYLMRAVSPDQVEHLIEAVAPNAATRRLLKIDAREPCLLLERRTWTRGAVVTWARLTHPGSRYRLGETFAHRP